MPPLILLLLIGGAVAVAASRNKKPPTLPGSFLYTGTKIEKFIDPHFSECWTKSPGGVENHRGDGGYETNPLSQGFRDLYDMSSAEDVVGLEYLGTVPNNAVARVAAMRSKIDKNGSALNAKYTPFRNASYEGFAGVARAVAEAVKDPAKAVVMARSLGVPTAKADDIRKQIVKLLEGPAGGVIKALYGEVGPPLIKLARQTVSEIVGDAKATVNSVGASAGAALPVVGMLVSVVTQYFGDVAASKAAATASTCKISIDEISRSLDSIARAGVSAPWHLVGTNCDGVEGGNAGTALNTAVGTARATEYYQLGVPPGLMWAFGPGGTIASNYGEGLSATDQVNIKKWWSIAQLLWLDDRVGPVMQTMANDYWKGELASDEQVMVVAAPIAVSYGLDVDEFARRLWSVSKGWRSRPELFVKREAGGGCGPIVDNARYIQFAVLTKDAFELAESMSAKK